MRESLQYELMGNQCMKGVLEALTHWRDTVLVVWRRCGNDFVKGGKAWQGCGWAVAGSGDGMMGVAGRNEAGAVKVKQDRGSSERPQDERETEMHAEATMLGGSSRAKTRY